MVSHLVADSCICILMLTRMDARTTFLFIIDYRYPCTWIERWRQQSPVCESNVFQSIPVLEVRRHALQICLLEEGHKNKLYKNLESCENTNAVTMPRCAFLTTVCTRILMEFKIKTSPSIVPLRVWLITMGKEQNEKEKKKG